MLIEKLMVAYLDDKAHHIYYLDKHDQVILLDSMETEGLPHLEFLDADEPERFVEVPKILNVESFSWMVEFESLNQHNDLLHALNEKDPFEGFNKRVDHLKLTEKWREFQKEKVRNRIQNWLTENHIVELQKQLD
ncbi:UPF0158 family protein [Fictibacillus nanhaiensis]|uniref:UPF0158 family protein n=1 Tax=Fictibacillus nanhaiensis TaxID=742169 RepID=UPI001C952C61|nr:UPF0158 family protein [Fictibacillus nanhaiensis]MBY6037537.1 UPF0158 family protein [Fictibacillus nanhaiensis]